MIISLIIGHLSFPRGTRGRLHRASRPGSSLGGALCYLGGLRSARRHVASFAGALAVLFVALNGRSTIFPTLTYLSAHMAQHLVLTLVSPGCWLYGSPAHVVPAAVRRRWVRRSAEWSLGHSWPRSCHGSDRHLAIPALLRGGACAITTSHIRPHLIFLTRPFSCRWRVLSTRSELPRIPHLLSCSTCPARHSDVG